MNETPVRPMAARADDKSEHRRLAVIDDHGSGHEDREEKQEEQNGDDEKMNEHGDKEDQADVEEKRDGLGQDGLRLDPQEFGEEEPETRKAKSGPLMFKPTKQEIEEHNKHHCPFQPWCEHCVRGRATNAQHRRKK